MARYHLRRQQCRLAVEEFAIANRLVSKDLDHWQYQGTALPGDGQALRQPPATTGAPSPP